MEDSSSSSSSKRLAEAAEQLGRAAVATTLTVGRETVAGLDALSKDSAFTLSAGENYNTHSTRQSFVGLRVQCS